MMQKNTDDYNDIVAVLKKQKQRSVGKKAKTLMQKEI
jgi:hypothetical protein